MSNRASEPQIIADLIDQLYPLIYRKFLENGIDAEEDTILDALTTTSDRAQRHAEVMDLSLSLQRVGINERNLRRWRDLFPDTTPAKALG